MGNKIDDAIHYGKLLELMQRTDNGRPVPFALVYVKKSTGEIVTFPKCWLSSVHAKGGTVNIFRDGDSHPIKIRRCLVLYINSLKVYM